MKYEKIEVVNTLGQKVEVKGRKVMLPHCPELFAEFYVQTTNPPHSAFKFHVSEKSTGASVGKGGTEEAAINDADENMRLYVPTIERWEQLIENNRKVQDMFKVDRDGQEDDKHS